MNTRKLLFTSVILLIEVTSFSASAQVVAGSIPAGTSSINSNLNLTRTGTNNDTVAFLDIDCDAINDLRVLLHAGNPSIDAPNDAALFVLNNSLTLCTDTGTYWTTTFHNFGDTLCTGYHQWNTDSTFYIGCNGSFGCYQPAAVSSKYIAYKKNSTQQVGWIKLSFNLIPATITLSLDTILVLCNPAGISGINNEMDFSLSPNPTFTGRIKIHLKESVSAVEICNAIGEIVKTISGNETEITLPEQKGMYIIRVHSKNGACFNRKVQRL